MSKKLPPGKPPETKRNRVDPSIQVPIAEVAMRHLVEEIDVLEALYQAEDFRDSLKEEGSSDDLFKRVASRNRAIQSQYAHIKMAAQAASGCIHPPGHNTVSEREASAELVEKLKGNLDEKLTRWKENKRQLQEKTETEEEAEYASERLAELY